MLSWLIDRYLTTPTSSISIFLSLRLLRLLISALWLCQGPGTWHNRCLLSMLLSLSSLLNIPYCSSTSKGKICNIRVNIRWVIYHFAFKAASWFLEWSAILCNLLFVKTSWLYVFVHSRCIERSVLGCTLYPAIEKRNTSVSCSSGRSVTSLT